MKITFRWGDQGFFKIERGTNACHVETYVVSASLWKNFAKNLG